MDMISAIYEAALLGDHWPNVLEMFSRQYNTIGSVIFANTDVGTLFTSDAAAKPLMEDFLASGLMEQNIRLQRMMASDYTGFMTDTDVVSETEMASHPLYTQFLTPRGFHGSVATQIKGIDSESVIFAVEGFASHQAARAAKPSLDAMRPHIARSVMVSSRLKLERARAMTDALASIGVPAAITTPAGQVRAVNDLFAPLLGKSLLDYSAGLQLADTAANRAFQAASTGMAASMTAARSLPLPGDDGRPRILHLLPIAGEARDLFSNASVLIVIAGSDTRTENISAPLMRALFDLTPAEARVAQALTTGLGTAEIAQQSGISIHTVRTQIKSILAKTNTQTQSGLIVLLNSLSRP